MKNLTTLLEKAIYIAIKAHFGQKDRYGAPYILHPLRVMNRVNTDDEKTVAILHDVVEDTDWTFSALRKKGFPRRIIAALDCVTKRDGEPYGRFVERSASNPLALVVKMADLEDNMDIRRIPKLDEEGFERLKKYHCAWHGLAKKRGAGA